MSLTLNARSLWFKWLVVALVWVASMTTESAQQAPVRDAMRPPSTGTASLAGTVVDDEAHTPIPHAVLTLVISGLPGQRTTSSDEVGRFLFPDLPAAAYTLSAARGAYLTTAYGALGPGAPALPIPLKEGQHFVAAPVVLTKGSVIAGRIVDAAGRPLADARVVASRVVLVDGERQAGPAALDRSIASTDSRGMYRIYGLPLGEYVVSVVSPSGTQAIETMSDAEIQWAEARQTARPLVAAPPPLPARPFSTAPTYFPGVGDVASASIISLGRADERTGVDFSVLRVNTARITGIVFGLDGQAAPGAIVLRTPKRTSSFVLNYGPGQSRSTQDGTFVLPAVPPGDYIVTVRGAAVPPASPSPGAPVGPTMALPSGPLTLWGRAEVSVNSDDIAGLEIHLQPGMTIAGSIAFEGTTPAPTDLSKFQPRLTVVGTDSPNVTVDQGGGAAKADRGFTIDAVMPGSYLLTGSGDRPTVGGSAPTWMIKSVMAGGRDLLNTPFDVQPREDIAGVVMTYTDRRTELDGQLRDATGQPVSDFRVLVFSTTQEHWATKILPRWTASVRAAADGTFRIGGLPPGEYYVCAFVDAGQAPSPDSALLTSLVPASIKITLAEGETHTQTFKVGG